MVSDQEIANGVESLLRQSDPNTFTSFSSVVEHLESKLGLDLTTKTGLIRTQIEFLLRPPPPPTTTTLLHTQTQTQTLVQQQQQQQPKDQHHLHHHHFAIQTQTHNPNLQFQNTHTQIPPHFALQHQHQLQQQYQQQQQRHHGEINFQCPPPPQQQQHQHQQQHHPLVQPQLHSRAHPQTQKSNAAGTPKESAPKRRGGPGGLNKVCGVSPELQAIVGEPTMPRTQIVKQLWAYIRKNNLQDPSNKRKIICNDELRLVFETDCTDMFKMNKLLAKHIIPLEPSKPAPVKKRQKVEAVEAATPSEPTEAKPDLVIISDALAKFFGTGDREMLQADALRRVWEYIQANHLQDPENSTVIICDAKLQELFGCESISALGVAEMVGHHFFKRS